MKEGKSQAGVNRTRLDGIQIVNSRIIEKETGIEISAQSLIDERSFVRV
jgi:hypothetical protein